MGGGLGAGQPEGGREGRENMGLLVGDVLEYRARFRRRGRRIDVNPFWDIQYTERTERQFLVGVKRDGTIQCGRQGVSGKN